MKWIVAALSMSLMGLGMGCEELGTQSSNDSSSQFAAKRAGTWCPSMTFTGDIHGAQATARITFEPHHEMGYVSGTITSQTSRYSFYGDTPIDVMTKVPVNSVMWVDVTEETGERFRAEINWYEKGFTFSPNPFGEGPYYDYIFYCSP